MVHVFSIKSDSLQPYGLCSPNSSVRGILQARTLEWVTIFFSRGSSRPREQTGVSSNSFLGRWILLRLNQVGSPLVPWPGIKLMPPELGVQSFNQGVPGKSHGYKEPLMPERKTCGRNLEYLQQNYLNQSKDLQSRKVTVTIRYWHLEDVLHTTLLRWSLTNPFSSNIIAVGL